MPCVFLKLYLSNLASYVYIHRKIINREKTAIIKPEHANTVLRQDNTASGINTVNDVCGCIAHAQKV